MTEVFKRCDVISDTAALITLLISWWSHAVGEVAMGIITIIFYSVVIWLYFKIFMHQQFSIMVWTVHVIKLPTHLRYFSGLKSVGRHNHLYNMIHYTIIYKWFIHTMTKIWCDYMIIKCFTCYTHIHISLYACIYMYFQYIVYISVWPSVVM